MLCYYSFPALETNHNLTTLSDFTLGSRHMFLINCFQSAGWVKSSQGNFGGGIRELGSPKKRKESMYLWDTYMSVQGDVSAHSYLWLYECHLLGVMSFWCLRSYPALLVCVCVPALGVVIWSTVVLKLGFSSLYLLRSCPHSCTTSGDDEAQPTDYLCQSYLF